jgi:hypothetical protein
MSAQTMTAPPTTFSASLVGRMTGSSSDELTCRTPGAAVSSTRSWASTASLDTARQVES